MSYEVIRKLLETQLNLAAGGVAIAFENVPYTPIDGTPFQSVNLLPGQTENPTMGDGFKREVGILQVMLNYPTKAGPQPAAARAEALRTAFKRGTTFVSEAVRVLIAESPFIRPALQGDGWYMLPVSIPYIADVQG